MDQSMWNKHKEHLDDHIMWPATKEEILAACEGTDVEQGFLQDINENLPEGGKKYTKQELYETLVME